jgi:hypothetical protein
MPCRGQAEVDDKFFRLVCLLLGNQSSKHYIRKVLKDEASSLPLKKRKGRELLLVLELIQKSSAVLVRHLNGAIRFASFVFNRIANAPMTYEKLSPTEQIHLCSFLKEYTLCKSMVDTTFFSLLKKRFNFEGDMSKLFEEAKQKKFVDV